MLCKLYTFCVNFYTYCVNSRCFVANMSLFRFTRFLVKSWPQKLRSGKYFDKYHVCLGCVVGNTIPWDDIS